MREAIRRVGVDGAEVDGGLGNAVGGNGGVGDADGMVRDAAQHHGRVDGSGDRLLPAHHGVQQVHTDEVGESGDGEIGEFLGGAGHAQGGADTGAGFLQQGQPLTGRVLLTAVERRGPDPDDPPVGIPDGPQLDHPGPLAGKGGGRGRGDVLIPQGPALLGDTADAAQEALVAGGLAQEGGARGLLAGLRGRVPLPRARGRGVRGERDRGLDERPLQHPVAAFGLGGPDGGGDDEALGRAVDAQRRVRVQGHVDAVAVPVPRCRRATPLLGCARGDPPHLGALPGEEEIDRGAPHHLRGMVAQQPPCAFAPSRDDALQADGGCRDIW